MNRNVTIVVILLVLVVIAGYLIWIRSRFETPVSPQSTTEVTVVPSPTSSSVITATPSATPGGKEATGSMKQKTSTSPAMAK